MHLLEVMAFEKTPIRLIDLAKRCEINSSTTLRYLSTLEELGYINKSSVNNRYSLTPKIFNLGNNSPSEADLTEKELALLQGVSGLFQAPAAIYIMKDNAVVCRLSTDESFPDIAYTPAKGDSAPLHCTAAGRLFLQRYSYDNLRDYILKNGLPRFTEQTITTSAGLQAELGIIANNNYAVTRGEYRSGITELAAPILNKDGEIVAAACIHATSSKLTDEYIFIHILDLISTCTEISQLI